MDYFHNTGSSSRANNASIERITSAPGASNIPRTPLYMPTTPRGDSFTMVRTRPPPPMNLRRLPSTPTINRTTGTSTGSTDGQGDSAGRRRSLSAPQRPGRPLSGQMKLQQPANDPLPMLAEEAASPSVEQQQPPLALPVSGRNRAASDAASEAADFVLGGRKRRSTSTARPTSASIHYEADVVDLLDVIDPEVSTLNTLNNVQNSLFIPNLGRFFNRQPTYELSRHESDLSRVPTVDETQELEMKKTEEEIPTGETTGPSIFGYPLLHSHSISSQLSETNYAVLPHGVVLEGWSEEDKAELNDHVRHLLHSRKAKFRRSMRAFGKYVRTPLGAFVTIYAFLITFWGAAWVLFIIGWLSVEGRQDYFIEICDQVLTALFCLVGLGLAPFRAVDTYHMIYIAKYHFKTLRLRREQHLPPLKDDNDLPEPSTIKNDEEAAVAVDVDAVLSPEEQRKFEHHRDKFCKSHTFYKPHETFTHRAFSITLLITVVVLLDCHSLFQMALGGTTWGIYYRRRPKALTAVILTCSICCNISGGLTISAGDRKTRKKDVVERIFRQALTEEALHKMEKKGLKSATNDEALAHEVLKSKEAMKEYEQNTVERAGVVANMMRP